MFSFLIKLFFFIFLLLCALSSSIIFIFSIVLIWKKRHSVLSQIKNEIIEIKGVNDDLENDVVGKIKKRSFFKKIISLILTVIIILFVAPYVLRKTIFKVIYNFFQ